MFIISKKKLDKYMFISSIWLLCNTIICNQIFEKVELLVGLHNQGLVFSDIITNCESSLDKVSL